jgi:hypothetical protein
LESAPSDYEPEYFKASDALTLCTEHLPLKINVGALKTPAIEMKVKFAGLESLLFEDLCKIGAAAGDANKTSDSLFSGENFANAATHRHGEEECKEQQDLAQQIGSMQVDSQEETHLDSAGETMGVDDQGLDVVAAVKALMYDAGYGIAVDHNLLSVNSLQEGVTSIRACCERLGVKEGDVKKAFVALTKEGVIQQKKRGGRYEVSQSAASTAASNTPLSFGSESRSTVVAAVTPNGARPAAAFFAAVAAEEPRDPADDIEEDLQDTPSDAQPHSTFTKQHLRLQPGLAKKQRGGAAAEAGAAVHVVEDVAQPTADLKRKAPQQEELVGGLLSQSSDNGKRARKCSVIRDPINVSLQLRQAKQ